MPDMNSITKEDVEGLKVVTLLNSNALDEYQRLATKTAIYPGCGTPLGLMYVALKMNGEAGEFAEHVGKAMRDDGLGNGLYYDNGVVQDGGHGLTSQRHLALVKEVGDVLWYLSAACNELGIKLSDVAVTNLEKLQSRTERGKLSGSGDNR